VSVEDIEDDLAMHLAEALSGAEKETLRLCRQLRNKVLHTDFLAARKKLNELGVITEASGVVKIELPIVRRPPEAEISLRVEEDYSRGYGGRDGMEGAVVRQVIAGVARVSELIRCHDCASSSW